MLVLEEHINIYASTCTLIVYLKDVSTFSISVLCFTYYFYFTLVNLSISATTKAKITRNNAEQHYAVFFILVSLKITTCTAIKSGKTGMAIHLNFYCEVFLFSLPNLKHCCKSNGHHQVVITKSNKTQANLNASLN